MNLGLTTKETNVLEQYISHTNRLCCVAGSINSTDSNNGYGIAERTVLSCGMLRYCYWAKLAANGRVRWCGMLRDSYWT